MCALGPEVCRSGVCVVSLVWLKRDLRIRDHAPLAEAAACGPIHVVYVYEPSLWRSAEYDGSHLRFCNECLKELGSELRARGIALVTRIGELPGVFDQIFSESPFDAIWAHQETGNRLTYDRDRRVATWCKGHGVRFFERPQHGVFRRLATRDGWARKWRQRMDQPTADVARRLVCAPRLESAGAVHEAELGLKPSEKSDVQRGGESHAHALVDSFLDARGVNYRADMASPVEGWEGCSRLSAHLAWGSISIRQVYQATKRRRAELKARRDAGQTIDPRWLPSLASFFSRLSWHCHFIQKLEDDPAIEFRNMSRAYDGLREDEFDEGRFQAWCAGQTGYPMVDACMRCLHATGWLNFRMRAMVVSFASYHLWLHWRAPAVYLAQHFLDFEAGVHFSQFQMQSGVTGINAVRIYSPAKQLKDQDPDGVFVRRWVPELVGVPKRYLAQPETMPVGVQLASGCRLGKDYPVPIVEHLRAYREARSRVYAIRRTARARAEAARVYAKHGSRKRPRSRDSSSQRPIER